MCKRSARQHARVPPSGKAAPVSTGAPGLPWAGVASRGTSAFPTEAPAQGSPGRAESAAGGSAGVEAPKGAGRPQGGAGGSGTTCGGSSRGFLPGSSSSAALLARVGLWWVPTSPPLQGWGTSPRGMGPGSSSPHLLLSPAVMQESIRASQTGVCPRSELRQGGGERGLMSAACRACGRGGSGAIPLLPAPSGLELQGEGSSKEKGAARRTEPPLWGGAQRNEDRRPLQVASRKIPPRC